MPIDYRIERWSAPHAPNSAMLRYTLVGEGYEVFQWCDRVGMFFGPHKHDEDQSHWIVSGQLEISMKDVGTFQLGPGDRDFMPAETWHSARVIGDEPVLYLIGIKQPPLPSEAPRKPKRTPTTKRKPTVKKTKPAGATEKSVTKKPKRNPSTKRKAAVKKGKPGKATKKKSKTKV
jgi:mannose-6-phosphate isomerase-like protein (cupin superfamily)